MSTTDLSLNPDQSLTALGPAHLPAQAEGFPGFALPEAALHSIPLPPEFNQFVQAASMENHVKSILPKYFNPIFRRQGVVNKHAIKALESVGQSLAQLAREIESRDRVLEQLAGHLNAQSGYSQQRYRALAHFTEQLGRELTDAASGLESRLARESADARLRSETLLASTRSLATQLAKLQATATEADRRWAESQQQGAMLKAEADRVATQLGSLVTDAADVRRRVEQLESTALNLEFRLADAAAVAAAAKAATEQGRQESAAALKESELRASDQVTDLWRQIKGRLVGAERDTKKRLDELEVRIGKASVEQEERLAKIEAQVAAQPAAASLSTAADTSALDARMVKATTEFDARLARIEADVAAQQAAADAGARANVIALADRIKALSTGTEAQNAEIRSLRQQLDAVSITNKDAAGRPEPTAESSDRTRAAVEALLQSATAEINGRLAAAEERESTLVANLRGAGQTQQTLSAGIDELRESIRTLGEIAATTAKRQEAAEGRMGGTNAALEALLAQVQPKNGDPAEAGENGSGARVTREAVEAAEFATSDGFYVALEARFRGPRGVVRERQTGYLPIIEEARTRIELFPPPSSDLPDAHPLSRLRHNNGVLDLGCGRGEWLNLLKGKDVPAVGVDRNRFFLQTCRQQGFDVIDADVIEFLRTAPSESVSAVTSFHLIEHLPLAVFHELVQQVYRVLRRGGTVVLETPNPANVLTSCLNFLLDPTHLRPIHPEFARFMLETVGFTSVQLKFMNPYDPSHTVGSPADPLAQRFNDYFHGPQDYAVIGVKP